MLFQLGQIVATPGALALMQETGTNPQKLLNRHVNGDWGDVCKEDAEENDFSVRYGHRILSSYVVGDGNVWIITEATRECTTFLLPVDY
jgi:hypothetical protein